MENRTTEFTVNQKKVTFLDWINKVKAYLAKDIDADYRADLCDAVLNTVAAVYSKGYTGISVDATICEILGLKYEDIREYVQDDGVRKVEFTLSYLDTFVRVLQEHSPDLIDYIESKQIFARALATPRPYLDLWFPKGSDTYIVHYDN